MNLSNNNGGVEADKEMDALMKEIGEFLVSKGIKKIIEMEMTIKALENYCYTGFENNFPGDVYYDAAEKLYNKVLGKMLKTTNSEAQKINIIENL